MDIEAYVEELARCAATDAVLASEASEKQAGDLKGRAVELWRDGRRLFVVADEHDAQLVMRRLSASPGEVWTGGELELVAKITDQAIRDEVAAWKRATDGRVREFWPKGEPR